VEDGPGMMARSLLKRKLNAVQKLSKRVSPFEYQKDEIEIVIDVLTDHYSELTRDWLDYYEELLSAHIKDRA
jgi:hypothetical protein